MKTRKWPLLIGIAAAWIVATLIYAFVFFEPPQNMNKVYGIPKFMFESIAALGVMFTALLTSFNTLEATQKGEDTAARERKLADDRFTHEQNLAEAQRNFDRVENAFLYFERWDSPSLKDARNFTRELGKIDVNLTPAQKLDLITKDQNLERSVITMFNFFEEIYMSIEANRVSGQYMKEAFADAYRPMHARFLDWINAHLKPTQKEHLDKLNTSWS